MVEWLEKFAQSRTKKMNKTASQVIVDKDKFPDAEDGDTVDFENQKYKVVDSNFNDSEGDGVVLESVLASDDAEEVTADEEVDETVADEEVPAEEVTAELEDEEVAPVEEAPVEPHAEPDVMDVAMGTSPAYEKHENKAQEYANVDPQVNDPDPRDDEVAKFEEEAKATEEAVAAEDAIDGTSGATKPNRILQRMYDSGAFEKTPVVEEEPAPVSDDDVIDLETYDFNDDLEFANGTGVAEETVEAPVEEPTEIAPVEEEPVEDILPDEDVEEVEETPVEDEVEEPTDETEETVEEEESVDEEVETEEEPTEEDEDEEFDLDDIASLTNEFKIVSNKVTSRLRRQ
jgi:hypothetical protein